MFYLHILCAYLQRPKEGIKCPETGVTSGLFCHHVGAGHQMQEQPVLWTLQPLKCKFFVFVFFFTADLSLAWDQQLTLLRPFWATYCAIDRRHAPAHPSTHPPLYRSPDPSAACSACDKCRQASHTRNHRSSLRPPWPGTIVSQVSTFPCSSSTSGFLQTYV